MDERRTDRAYASFLRRFPTRLSQRCSPIRHSPYGAHAVKHVVETTEVAGQSPNRSEEHTSELQSQSNLVCRLLLEKKKSIVNLSIPPRWVVPSARTKD